MRSIFILFMLIFITTLLSGQQNLEMSFKQLESRGVKIVEAGINIIKLEYPDGRVEYLNIANYTGTGNAYFDSTIIDLINIDTSSYYGRYSFWQEVEVGTVNTKPPLVADVNNNKLPEIYGIMKDYISDETGVVIMEKNSQDNFDSIYCYDSTSAARTVLYDIDSDGWDELYLHRNPSDTNYPGSSYLFFKKQFDTSLATDLSFVFYPFPIPSQSQLNNNTFGNWVGDENTDQIFIKECCPNSIFIYEYNELLNRFDSVYYYDPSQFDFFFSGFAVGDINQNGRTEFFAGSVHGKVIAIENCGNNCYSQIWQGSVGTNNAYLYAATNDLDDNGKPELWVGGYHFQDGEAITRVTIFEADGNNSYLAVGKIDIIGAFNTYCKNMQVMDVDKDGIAEVIMAIDQHVLILKFNGSINHHTYEVFYSKRNDLAFSGQYSVFYGAVMYDVTGDGKEDIIIHMDEFIPNVGMKLFTFIYKADFTVDIKTEDFLPRFKLYQNYPNPFNPSTSIKFEVPEYSNVSLKVYDILGKEIATLLENELSPGKHEITWDAKDSNGRLLPSGVYLIKLCTAGATSSYVRTLKATLIK